MPVAFSCPVKADGGGITLMLDPDFFGDVVEDTVLVAARAPKAGGFPYGFFACKIAFAEFLPDRVQVATQVVSREVV